MQKGQLQKREADFLRHILKLKNMPECNLCVRFKLSKANCRNTIRKLESQGWISRDTIKLTGGLMDGTEHVVFNCVATAKEIAKYENLASVNNFMNALFRVSNGDWLRFHTGTARANQITKAVTHELNLKNKKTVSTHSEVG